MSKPQVVFIGAGPVAAASLELLAKWATVEAVITKPKPAHHKGSFPVLDAAEQLNVPVHTVTDKRFLNELILTNPFKSQLAILIDFGIIVSQDVIDYFPLGIINSHFSLLPEWRGADPITFSILSGQKTTGVSLMLLTAGMDEGPILSTNPFDIRTDETTPTLTDALITVSDQALAHTVPGYIEGAFKPLDQLKIHEQIGDQIPMYPSEPTYSRKLSKADSILDFTKPAIQLEREIRGFIEWPKSRTTLGGKDVIITKAHAVSSTMDAEPGYVEIIKEQGILMINTTDGYLCVDSLKPAGKGEMDSKSFLAGYQI